MTSIWHVIDYSNKTDKHLSDQNTYIVVNEDITMNNFDPNITLQPRLNRDLEDTKSRSMITESEYTQRRLRN